MTYKMNSTVLLGGLAALLSGCAIMNPPAPSLGPNQFVVIVRGEAAVTRGGEHLATLLAGESFGEMALVDGSLRSATVTATTAMHVLVLDPRSFWSLIGIGNVAQVLLRGVVERLRHADEALASNR